MKGVPPFLALVSALAIVAAGCSARVDVPTSTPVPTPTPRPTPTPAPTPTTIAPPGVDARLAESLAALPSSVRLAVYFDLTAINANPKLKAAVDETITKYLGDIARFASSLGTIDRVAISLQSPFRMALQGNFSGALVVTALAAGGSPTTEYKGVRYVQFSRDGAPGLPRFIAFPSRGIGLLAETPAAMESLIDVQTAAPGATFLASDGVIGAVRNTGAGLAVAVGQPGDVARLAPTTRALGVGFGGVALSRVDNNTAEVTAFVRFNSESAAISAQAAAADQAGLARLLNAPAINQLSDVRITRNGPDLVAKAKAPVDAAVNSILTQVKP